MPLLIAGCVWFGGKLTVTRSHILRNANVWVTVGVNVFQDNPWLCDMFLSKVNICWKGLQGFCVCTWAVFFMENGVHMLLEQY